MNLTTLIGILLAVYSIVLHECAHGWMAYRLGDPTAKNRGRLTLNPFKHIDPIGTILVPLALFLLRALGLTSFMFGWAKPVPINFNGLQEPRRDKMLVALAGPVTNLIFAFGLAQVIRFSIFGGLGETLALGVWWNVSLAIFNLIPIPPLDGSWVVSGLLPENLERIYSQLTPYGIIIVIILVNSQLMAFLFPLIEGIVRWMGVINV